MSEQASVQSGVDPIIAIATPPGRGAVGIVRLSGPDLSALIVPLCGRLLVPRHATYLPLRDDDREVIDRGLAIAFAAPHSYTGEHVLELQVHGGPVVLQLLLARCLALAAEPDADGRPRLPRLRLARPGEFTERAFLNGKLDLAQAESVADLIDAGTAAAARSAARSLMARSRPRSACWPIRCSTCACWWKRHWTSRKKSSTFSNAPMPAAASKRFVLPWRPCRRVHTWGPCCATG